MAMLDASASGQRVLSVSWTGFTAPGVNLPPRRLTTSKCLNLTATKVQLFLFSDELLLQVRVFETM